MGFNRDDGSAPRCPACLVTIAIYMRREHPASFSIGMLKRRIARISGREAAILVEATRWMR